MCGGHISALSLPLASWVVLPLAHLLPGLWSVQKDSFTPQPDVNHMNSYLQQVLPSSPPSLRLF